MTRYRLTFVVVAVLAGLAAGQAFYQAPGTAPAAKAQAAGSSAQTIAQPPAQAAAPNNQIPAEDARFKVRNTNTAMAFVPYASREAWLERAEYLRRQVLMAAGLWPMPERTPLNAQVFDRLDREGYSIEKAYFESYPGFFCTGNLYRPRGKQGPFPAVWSPHGHWAYGRLEHTDTASIPARAVNLARQGYVVFTPDMVGYDDSQQVPHQYGGPRQQLWAVSVLGLQLWNSIRGLDFLQSLPDVDPQRIGVTGASGGGTQTFLLTAVDDRVTASAPVNMISTIMQGGSNCENAANLRIDTFNVEIGALAAPHPLLMVAATGDWTKATPTVEFPAMRSIYRLMDAEERVESKQFNAPHNYNRDSRETVYAFFGRVLLGDKDATHFKERSISVESPEKMLVFYNRKRPDGVTEETLLAQRIEESERQLAALKPVDTAGLEKFREVMGAALRQSLQAAIPAPADVLAEATAAGEVVIGRRGKGDRIPGTWWQPKTPAKKAPGGKKAPAAMDASVVLLIHPEGREAAGKSVLAAELLRRGTAVFSIDAFQTGKHRGTRNTSDRMFTTYNRTDDAERVQDILTAIAYLKSPASSARDAQVDVVGLDRAGLWVLLARAMAPADAVRRTVADTRQFDPSEDSEYVEALFIPLLRRAGDFRTAQTLIAPSPLLVYNTGVRFGTSWGEGAYNVAGKPGNLLVRKTPASEPEIADWLAK